MRKLLKTGAIFVIAVPVLLVAQCVYLEVSQQSALEALCTQIAIGSAAGSLAAEVEKTPFQIRSNDGRGKDESDWFEREYSRIGVWLQRSKAISDNYTVIFAKPGMGYYACIVLHRDNTVSKAWFEDRSS